MGCCCSGQRNLHFARALPLPLLRHCWELVPRGCSPGAGKGRCPTLRGDLVQGTEDLGNHFSSMGSRHPKEQMARCLVESMGSGDRGLSGEPKVGCPARSKDFGDQGCSREPKVGFPAISKDSGDQGCSKELKADPMGFEEQDSSEELGVDPMGFGEQDSSEEPEVVPMGFGEQHCSEEVLDLG